MTQIEAKKCKAETYESWETVKSRICICQGRRDQRVWQIFLSPYFFPNLFESPSFLWAIERSLGLERRQDGGYILLLKYVDENIVSRDKMGLLCIFVDDQRSPTTHFSTPGSISSLKSGHFLYSFEKWRFWWVLLNLLNFLAHISVKLSLNHVLLWDNLKVNVKKNSVEFRGLISVNKKQEIL